MKIEKLGVDKEANVILGAGASRGASCFEGLWAKSPLDGDFFDQVDRLKALKDGSELAGLAEFARDEFGVSNSLPMESFFTQLESLDEFYRELKIDRGPRVRSYQSQLEKFPNYVAAVFRALRSIEPSQNLSCAYHSRLARALRARDAVISFNYDCIVDSALKEARKSWDASRGYGFTAGAGVDNWQDHSGRGRVAKHTIKLLKVHGSLNWIRGTDPIGLRADPYEVADRSKNQVVPPVWNKRISQDAVMASIWKEARQTLRTGPILVVIGYSVPETDLLSQVLLRVATSESGKNLTHLIIANPDPAARRGVDPA